MSFSNVHFDQVHLKNEALMRLFMWSNTVEQTGLFERINHLQQRDQLDVITVLLKLMKPKHRDYILKQWEDDKEFWDDAFLAFQSAVKKSQEFDASVLLPDAEEIWKCFICGIGLEGGSVKLKQCGACVSHYACWESVLRRVRLKRLNQNYPFIGPCHCSYLGRGPEDDWNYLLGHKKQQDFGLYEKALEGMEPRKKKRFVDDLEGPDDAADTANKRRKADHDSAESESEGTAESDQIDEDTEQDGAPRSRGSAGDKRKRDEGNIEIDPAYKKSRMSGTAEDVDDAMYEAPTAENMLRQENDTAIETVAEDDTVEHGMKRKASVDMPDNEQSKKPRQDGELST
ncbi:hypothetical protein PCL_08369 [Purpureocillium lilacinum]|uniref:Uncharacterized protein n=1 Tax=Purpureocillium lilacinum TaxID=33203 RepID=A0A2U3DRX3_PURLI|nr:hypothetical protein PCL_08369 [Purpureocillium lilacinum]